MIVLVRQSRFLWRAVPHCEWKGTMSSGDPRSDADIEKAILVINDVMIKSMNYPPQLIVMAPTIRECLQELLEWRQGRIKRSEDEQP